MNNFDEMIEKYSKELVNAKRKSISKAIEEDIIEESISENSSSAEQCENSGIDFCAEETEEQIINENTNQNDSTQNEILIQEEIDLINDNSNEEDVSNDTSDESNNFQAQNAPNSSFGSLKVQVSAADRVYPISAAYVSVKSMGGEKVFFQGYTDASGIVDDIILPAPDKSIAAAPTNVKPYSQYDLIVEHPRFIPRKFIGVPVFASIKSIQSVQLVPTGCMNAYTEIVTESEPNELLLKTSEV